MLDDLELSLMAFPQSWTKATNTLAVNLLVLPIGNPLGPVGSVPKFAGTTLKLEARLLTGAALPSTATPPALTTPFVAVPPPGAPALLAGLQARMPAGSTITTGKVTPATAPAASVRVKKALPPSYTSAIPFSRSRDSNLFVVGDGYGCAVKAQDPGVALPKPAPTIAWGQLISYILQQPALALACGFVYQTSLVLPPASVDDISWISFAIDASNPANPFVPDLATPDRIRSYAARLPPLDANRKLFAAVLFPVVQSPQATLAIVDLESEIYDDGFAQIVHCHQPPTFDTATGGTDGMAPGAEPGVQLAWDDEQVTVWLDRQVGLLRDRANNTATNPEAPLGVLGYRVDVREAGTTGWGALCGVSGSLPFNGKNASGAGSTPSGELFINPAPIRSLVASAANDPGWLPLYFAAWRGSSLVVVDPTIAKLNPPGSIGPTPTTSLLSPIPVAPPRYGHSYEFRVRLADLTGGGPTSADAPVHPGLVPIGLCPFRRHIAPKALEVTTTPPPPKLPAKPAASRTITKLVVKRPFIGYPEAIFAGVPASKFHGASLDALITEALAARRAIGVPDPDVDRFRVTVEAATPTHDTGVVGNAPGDLDGGKWRVIYSIVEKFPANPGGSVVLSLDYQDIHDIAAMTPPADGAATLPIPTARDIRIRLTPLSEEKSNYYGATQPPEGAVSDFFTRREAASEAKLFSIVPEKQLLACWLQSGDDLAARVGQSFGLVSNGLTVIGPPGRRTVFGASGALRCTLAPDSSALTFATADELLNHWIVALIIEIERDWTWDGFSTPALTVTRDGAPIGAITFPTSVADIALAGATDRTTTRLVFLDAISPQPKPGSFPTVLNPAYAVTANFIKAPAMQHSWTTLRLPITTPPSQTPRIVSTGIVEGPFVAAPDYSSTSRRDRFLWVEFDRPIADSADDQFFGRVLSYGPDPMLAVDLLPPGYAPQDQADPPLAIDPEPVRVVFAGQDIDKSGLDAMSPLIPANASSTGPDGVHYILPLPPGLTAEALELFGFWTYEFRVGHSQLWSTAQGRFGRPLRVAGIQHPAPHLTCSVWRNKAGVSASAAFATTLIKGQPAFDLRRGDPQTALWFLLYAQVTQLDGAAQRNILLGRERAVLLRPPSERLANAAHGYNREPHGGVIFPTQSINAILDRLQLPRSSSLSVIGVEVLPGPIHVKHELASMEVEASTLIGEDPLGAQLGERRILRTSPLTAVPAIC
jgi:hypothetical protein